MPTIITQKIENFGEFSYIYVKSLDDINESDIERLKQAKSLSVDTETTGLDFHRDRVRLLQVSPNDSGPVTVFVFDLFSLRVEASLSGEKATDRALPPSLVDFFLQFLGDVRPKIAHNIVFDLSMLYFELGEFLLQGTLWDTYTLSRIDTNGLPNVSNSLEAAARRYLKINLDKTEQKSDWSGDLTEQQIRYAATDVACLKKLCGVIWSKLKNERLSHIVELELSLIPIINCANIHGWTFDKKEAYKTLEELERQKDEALKTFLDYLDSQLPEQNKLPRDSDGSFNTRPKSIGRGADKKLAGFNPGSAKQVGDYFAQIGVPLTLTAKGSYSVDQVSLSFIRPEYKVVDLYLNFKKANTAISQCTKLIEESFEHKGHNIITFSLNPLGTATGRFSCTNPNLQQIPRSPLFRKLFVARPGYKLVVADYSGMELRMCAEVAPVQSMISAFANNEDLHRKTAAAITGKPQQEVTKAERTAGKIINFSLLYGGGANALQRQAASGYNVLWTKGQAEEYRARFFNLYPELVYWHDKISSICKDPRYTTVFTKYGRRRYLVGSAEKSELDEGGMPTDRLTVRSNTTVQGSSADVVKLAILGAHQALHFALGPIDNCEVRFLCQVHDELVLEVREDKAEEVKEILVNCMVAAGNKICNNVTLEVEAGIGDTWAEAK